MGDIYDVDRSGGLLGVVLIAMLSDLLLPLR